MKQEIEDYLKRLKEQFDYTEEQLESVREFRQNAEHLPWEQYRFLLEQRLLNRSRKLKKVRNLYFKDEKIYYLNHYNKTYEWIATFHSDEFLAERKLKELQERELIERIRTDKKVLKAEANKPKEIEVIVKPKRKRINA